MKPLKKKRAYKEIKEIRFHGPVFRWKESIYDKGSLKLRIPNPHQGDISVSLIKEILKQADISDDEWDLV